jgi:hypothetical protein
MLIANQRMDAEKFPWILENPYRKYWGLEVLFNKRFSNRWQLLASYVYGKATGTVDNSFGGDIGWSGDRSDPNVWINAEGNLTNDPTHMFKVQGTYVMPLDINFNFYFRAITGDAWTTNFETQRFNQGRILILAEARGSHHYPLQKNLDLRLEKTFTLAKKYRLGVMVDVFNVFNDDTVNAWGTVIDGVSSDWFTDGSYASTQGHDLYGISAPRQARVGLRLMF